jgi:hypothetical protein
MSSHVLQAMLLLTPELTDDEWSTLVESRNRQAVPKPHFDMSDLSPRHRAVLKYLLEYGTAEFEEIESLIDEEHDEIARKKIQVGINEFLKQSNSDSKVSLKGYSFSLVKNSTQKGTKK